MEVTLQVMLTSKSLVNMCNGVGGVPICEKWHKYFLYVGIIKHLLDQRQKR